MNINEKVTPITGARRNAMTALMMMTMILGVLMQTGCATSSQANRGESNLHASHQHHAMSDTARSALTTPPAIVTEHDHLHHELDAAIASGGRTGASARQVAALLQPHFEEEEAYAMPPLGLLGPLSRNEPLDEATVSQAIKMAERLQDQYANMLREHKEIVAALRQLKSAALEENKPEYAAFADALVLHAQQEEQVLYPTTIVIGQFLKLKQQQAREAAQLQR